MTTIFDSAQPVNPLYFTARPFAAGIDLAPAVEPIAWPTHHALGRNPNPPTEADNSADLASFFHPTPEEDAWQSATSPLNAKDDEDAALDALYSEIESDREWADCLHDEPTAGAWGGHPDRVDLDA